MSWLWHKESEKRYKNVLHKLRGRIALSGAFLWAEAISRSFWPLWTLILSFYAFAAFQGFTLLDRTQSSGLLAVLAVTFLALAAYGYSRFNRPAKDAGMQRLDFGTDEHPISSLADRPVGGMDDPLTIALWEKHQARMAERAGSAKVAPPDLRLSSRDRYGLRLMAMVAALVAIVFAPKTGIDAINDVFAPPANAIAAGPAFEGWINPPSYTGLPTIYLPEVAAGESLFLPQGSEVFLRVYSAGSNLKIEQDVSKAEVLFTGEGDSVVRDSEFVITNSGDITISDGRKSLGRWHLIVKEDQAPEVAFVGETTSTVSGVMQVPFSASDDYGVVVGDAVITLDLDRVDRHFGLVPDPVEMVDITVDLPMPLKNDTGNIEEVLAEDFSKHLWAGLPVTIRLSVSDDMGQQGFAELETILRGRRFYMPLAAAFAEQRRDLMWSSQNDQRVLNVLRAATNLPVDLGLSTGTYLLARTSIRRLGYMMDNGLSNDERAEIAELFWTVAMLIEEGDLSDARERMRRAQERLSRAIQENASPDEIAELMDELRDATGDYMRQLQQEAGESQNTANSDGEMIDQNQIQEMMNRIQELAENGQQEEARELLEELRRMMENLQMAQSQGGQSGEQMEGMQDTLQQQQDLSDQTYQELQEMLENGLEDQSQTAEQLAEQQEALRQMLEELRNQSGAGSQQEMLDDAERNMGEARDHLEGGDLGSALDEQAEVIENLRDGIRQLGEEMQRADQGRDGMQAGETGDSPDEIDPLGRPMGSQGSTEANRDMIEDENAYKRARELLDEIRRRAGETYRTAPEIDYLKRLLDRF